MVQAKGILGVAPGSFVAIDGTSGDVIITPSDTDTAALAERSRRRAAALAGSTTSAEPNPALGCRGLRLSMAREDLLDGCDLWVMAPMVATQEEAEWFVRRARSFGLPQVGVMVETPAAALTAERLLGAADFASIGTNDLL